MENKFCISSEKVEELVKTLQAQNPHYTRETIEKAILQCCKNPKDPLNFKNFEECVAFCTTNYHLNG